METSVSVRVTGWEPSCCVIIQICDAAVLMTPVQCALHAVSTGVQRMDKMKTNLAVGNIASVCGASSVVGVGRHLIAIDIDLNQDNGRFSDRSPPSCQRMRAASGPFRTTWHRTLGVPGGIPCTFPHWHPPFSLRMREGYGDRLVEEPANDASL